MKNKILLILTTIFSFIIINLSTCTRIKSGMFAGRLVCYLGQVTINPGVVVGI